MLTSYLKWYVHAWKCPIWVSENSDVLIFAIKMKTQQYLYLSANALTYSLVELHELVNIPNIDKIFTKCFYDQSN